MFYYLKIHRMNITNITSYFYETKSFQNLFIKSCTFKYITEAGIKEVQLHTTD